MPRPNRPNTGCEPTEDPGSPWGSTYLTDDPGCCDP